MGYGVWWACLRQVSQGLGISEFSKSGLEVNLASGLTVTSQPWVREWVRSECLGMGELNGEVRVESNPRVMRVDQR